jgi:hypothetical protein
VPPKISNPIKAIPDNIKNNVSSVDKVEKSPLLMIETP